MRGWPRRYGSRPGSAFGHRLRTEAEEVETVDAQKARRLRERDAAIALGPPAAPAPVP